MQLAAIIVSLVLTVVGVALIARAVAQIYRFVRLGQPVPAGTRTDDPKQRTITLAKEFLGHTRMNRWGIVGFAHWFVAIGFLTLPPTLAQAYGQLFQADWTLPVIGGFLPFEMYIEFIGLMTVARHRHADRHPAAEPALAGRPQVPLRGLQGLAGVLRRVRHPHHRPRDPRPARARGRAPPRRRLRGRVLRLVPAGRSPSRG